MRTVEFEKDFAIDLIETKLAVVNKEIQAILENWNQESAEEMIKKTRKGELSEAENDAISLTNLVDMQNYLEEVLQEIEE